LITRVVGKDKQIVSIDDDLVRYSHNEDGCGYESEYDLVMYREISTNEELLHKYYPEYDTWSLEYQNTILRFAAAVRADEDNRILFDARLNNAGFMSKINEQQESIDRQLEQIRELERQLATYHQNQQPQNP